MPNQILTNSNNTGNNGVIPSFTMNMHAQKYTINSVGSTHNFQHQQTNKILNIRVDSTGDLHFTFVAEEKNVGETVKTLNVELTPEQNINGTEHIKITQMIVAVSENKVNAAQIMQYIRLHNLERHFKITLAV